MSEIITEKANIKTHKDLDVWKKSMDLVEEVYRRTDSFPPSEKYGLTNQIRRCVVSVSSNIHPFLITHHSFLSNELQ